MCSWFSSDRTPLKCHPVLSSSLRPFQIKMFFHLPGLHLPEGQVWKLLVWKDLCTQYYFWKKCGIKICILYQLFFYKKLFVAVIGPVVQKIITFSNVCLSVTDRYILMKICPETPVRKMSQPAKFKTCIFNSIINIQSWKRSLT